MEFYVEDFYPINNKLYGPERSVSIPSPTHEPIQDKAVKAKARVVQPRKDKPSVPTISGTQDRRDYGAGEIQNLIRKYSAEYGIDAESPLCVAKKESGFNPNARNKSSSASGVFQYLSGTWKATDEGKAGLSVFNADANIKAAIKYMASRGNTKPWEVRNKCPRVTRINQ